MICELCVSHLYFVVYGFGMAHRLYGILMPLPPNTVKCHWFTSVSACQVLWCDVRLWETEKTTPFIIYDVFIAAEYRTKIVISDSLEIRMCRAVSSLLARKHVLVFQLIVVCSYCGTVTVVVVVVVSFAIFHIYNSSKWRSFENRQSHTHIFSVRLTFRSSFHWICPFSECCSSFQPFQWIFLVEKIC